MTHAHARAGAAALDMVAAAPALAIGAGAAALAGHVWIAWAMGALAAGGIAGTWVWTARVRESARTRVLAPAHLAWAGWHSAAMTAGLGAHGAAAAWWLGPADIAVLTALMLAMLGSCQWWGAACGPFPNATLWLLGYRRAALTRDPATGAPIVLYLRSQTPGARVRVWALAPGTVLEHADEGTRARGPVTAPAPA